MKNLRIGIDIDGTVTCPNGFINFLNNSFQTNITPEDLKDKKIKQLINVSSKRFTKWLADNEEIIYGGLPLAKHAKEVLQQWNQCYEIFYITARSKKLEAVTLHLLRKSDLPSHHIEFVGNHNKIEAIKKHQIDVFIEDNYANACSISENCHIPVLLMDIPYNRHPKRTNIIRISGWQDADRYLSHYGFFKS